MEDLVRLAVIFIIITLIVIFFILEVHRNVRESARSGYIINNWATAGIILLLVIVLLVLVYCVAASCQEQWFIIIVALILLMAPLALSAMYCNTARS